MRAKSCFVGCKSFGQESGNSIKVATLLHFKSQNSTSSGSLSRSPRQVNKSFLKPNSRFIKLFPNVALVARRQQRVIRRVFRLAKKEGSIVIRLRV